MMIPLLYILNSTFMTLKSIISFCLITLISFLICFAISLAILYIWGLNDDTIRAGVSILFFGTILIALMLGAFDD